MIKLLCLLFLSYQHPLDTAKKIYLFKDSLDTEIISINKNGSYECISKSKLAHTYKLYSQGHFVNKNETYFFTAGVVDSVELRVIERESSNDLNKHFRSIVKLVGDKTTINNLVYFNMDPFNKVTYVDDIKLCIENDIGTKFYRRLDRETMDFGPMIVEGNAKFLYLTIGSYVVSKKHNLKLSRPTEVNIFLNKSDGLSNFCDFYLANHTFELKGGALIDMLTGKEFKQIFPKKEHESIQEILKSYY